MDMEEARLEQWREDVEIGQVEEDDFGLEWEEFKRIHPNISFDEFERAVKKIQEM